MPVCERAGFSANHRKCDFCAPKRVEPYARRICLGSASCVVAESSAELNKTKLRRFNSALRTVWNSDRNDGSFIVYNRNNTSGRVWYVRAGVFSIADTFSDYRETPHQKFRNDRGFPIRVFNGHFPNCRAIGTAGDTPITTCTATSGNTAFCEEKLYKPYTKTLMYCSPNRWRQRVR